LTRLGILNTTALPNSSPLFQSYYSIFRLQQRKISSLGIASFGPVDLNTKSATYVRMRAMQCRHVFLMTLLCNDLIDLNPFMA
jgi:hypothetical protein